MLSFHSLSNRLQPNESLTTVTEKTQRIDNKGKKSCSSSAHDTSLILDSQSLVAKKR